MTNDNEIKTRKSLGLIILLSVIIYGLGQIYLGLTKRGLTILIVGYAIAIVLWNFLPFYLSGIFIVGYWIWQIVDAYKSYNLRTRK